MSKDRGNGRVGGKRERGRFDPDRIDVGRLFDKVPPHAMEAECALLGSMILDWKTIGDVVLIVAGPDDFYKDAHATIYSHLVEMYQRNEPVDLVPLKQRLADAGELEGVGGVDYLVMLVESMSTSAHAPQYAQIVRDKSLLRRLIGSASDILYDAYHGSETVEELLNKAEQSIFSLAEARIREDASDLATLLNETYERLEAHDGRAVTGLETGFFELDEMTSGLQNGELIILAARPSMGKTALALNIAEAIAVQGKQPVAVFSLEMGKQQLAQRLLCSRSGVDSHRLRRNMLTDNDWPQLHTAVGELSEAPLFIDDTPGLNLLGLHAKARRLSAKHHIKAVFVDYLQLMSNPGSESRQQEVSELSRGIKALARELDVPVICLSQLNRAAEQREGHRPRMSDLRESGSIEQDADVVLMLHREDYYHRGDDDYEETNVAELILAKQRNGPTGTVKLMFNGQTTRFHNLSTAGVAAGGGDDF